MGTSLLSITHRITGGTLWGMMAAGSIAMVASPHDFPTAVEALKAMEISPVITHSLKFAVAWPFTYHFANGIRHLVWDMGKGFELPQLYQTGYAVLGTSVVTA